MTDTTYNAELSVQSDLIYLRSVRAFVTEVHPYGLSVKHDVDWVCVGFLALMCSQAIWVIYSLLY